MNIYMFPVEDLRGRQEPVWLAHAIELVEAKLRSVDFTNPAP